MLKKYSIFIIFISFFISLQSILFGQSYDSLNTSLVGRTYSVAEDISVRGSYAYLAQGDSGLSVINIDNPEFPLEVGSVRTRGYASTLVVNSTYAYVINFNDGLSIIDISNPELPTERGFFEITTGWNVRGVAVNGDYAYVTAGPFLYIINISNPEQPTEISSYSQLVSGRGLEVIGSYAYIADYDGGLRIIDVSDPINPTETGSFYPGSFAFDVVVQKGFAYVANYKSGLRIIDVSDPANPTETGFFDTGDEAYGVAINDSYAYVADDDDGLRVIDISNPTLPTEVGFFDMGINAWNVAVRGNLAYVVVLFEGLFIIQNDLLVSIEDNSSSIVSNYFLGQNFPNPFNPITKITFSLPYKEFVQIDIYNVLGERIKGMVNKEYSVGTHTLEFDGSQFASGLYFYQIRAGKFNQIKKMVLLK